MKFSIIPVHIGKRSKIYTIQLESEELDEYKNFIYENYEKVPDAVRILDVQLKNIAYKNGIYDEQFIRESPPEYNVYRLSETNDWLRLYCIKYSRVALVIGGGGVKNPGKYKLQENPELNKVGEFLMKIEDIISEAISNKETIINDDGFEGKLDFEILD